jgi:hypothetical protein
MERCSPFGGMIMTPIFKQSILLQQGPKTEDGYITTQRDISAMWEMLIIMTGW